jgi:hypothetical protein
MIQNNQPKDLAKKYQQHKTDFLDSLQPDDFRNGGSFNQAELIIDQINKALLSAKCNQKNSRESIKKAISHLFRENSPAAEKAIALSEIYLEMMSDTKSHL